jgi:hypothetical protein
VTAAELAAQRAAAALADYMRELHTAPLCRPPGREWMSRLADVLGDLLAALDQPHAGAEDARGGVTARPAARSALETSGPFETEAQVRERPEIQAVREAFDRDPGVGKMAPHLRRLLGWALEAAGADMGRYDDRIAEWLSRWEPQAVAVIAGWIARAHVRELEEARAALLSSYAEPAVTLGYDQAATALDALAVAAEYRRYRASLTCEACAQHPAELCEDHAADLDRADEYDRLAAQIGGAQ